MYILTEEGEKYVKKKLPELNLVELLSKGPVEMRHAIRDIEDFHIALQWAKKNGWMTIRHDIIHMTHKPSLYKLQDALNRIAEGYDADDETIGILMQRHLVRKQRENIVERAQKFSGHEVAGLNEDIIKTGMWRTVRMKPYNVEAPGKKIYPGKKQPYAAFLDEVRDKMTAMGFEEMAGPLLETEFWNMDALYMPQFHSARDIHDAYFIKYPKYAKNMDEKVMAAVKNAHEHGVDKSKGWEYNYDMHRAHRYILRTHGTVLSAHTLSSKPRIPGKYFALSTCFRYDVIDATHLPNFFQLEGIVLDHDLNFRHLVWMLKEFAKEFADTEQIKLVPGYFPFTEPSVEMHARHPELGWIELGGAGIFRPELTKPLGIDVPVIAWGLGIDRIGMFNMGMKDIRDLFSMDISYLRKSKVRY